MIGLDPVEWDFRKVVATVGAEHFPLLRDYEYARENVRFREKFVQWKDTRINVPGRARKQMIRELLLGGIEGIPLETKAAILLDFPGKPWTSLEWLAHFSDFPKPFLCADSGWRPSHPYKRPIIVEPKYAISEVGPFSTLARYHLAIQWDHYSPGQIIKAFKTWVNENKPTEYPTVKAQGRKPLFEKMKWLAALRIEKATNLHFSEIQAQLRRFRAQNPTPKEAEDVLPIYQREHKWKEAVSKARNYVESFTP